MDQVCFRKITLGIEMEKRLKRQGRLALIQVRGFQTYLLSECMYFLVYYT